MREPRRCRAGPSDQNTLEFRTTPLPTLSAAVEVAAYRIVVEALTNVTRHSASPTASVTVEKDSDALSIEVLDHGASHGSPTGRWTAGVGISRMHERAAEVGGTLTAAPRDGGGGRVIATLPLRSDDGVS